MLKVQLVHHLATFSKGTKSSTGYDLSACLDDSIWIQPNQTAMVSTGVKLDLPDNLDALLLPRSGLGMRGLVLGNLVGLIDTDYTDVIQCVLWNRTDEPIEVTPAMRIAQLKLTTVVSAPIVFVDYITPTGRGGFGSTGDM